MTQSGAGIGGGAAELRRAFDRSFSVAPSETMAALDHLLALRVAGITYAVRMSASAGLYSAKHISRVPSLAPAFHGIAAFRGAIVPVYDLHTLLGYPPVVAPKWLLIAAANVPVAFAFEHFEGHLRVSGDAFSAMEKGHSSRHAQEMVRVAETSRYVIDVPSVVDAILKLAPPGTQTREP
jgi:chemotaxis signal transduction protein